MRTGSEVAGNVSLFRNHSATLGYYLCDDCCPVDANVEQVALQAQLYNIVKSLDPLHLTYAPRFSLWDFLGRAFQRFQRRS